MGNMAWLKSAMCKFTTKMLLSGLTLLHEYDDTVQQYLLNNYAKCIPDPSAVSGLLCYMAHHAVICQDQETTNIRITFNASSKMSS